MFHPTEHLHCWKWTPTEQQCPRNCLSTHHIQVLACLWSLSHANIMPFLSGQVTKLCCVRQQFCSKHPLCIKIIWCISVLFFMKSGIWAIPGEAVQSKTPQSCDQAGPIDCYWLLNWGRQQANGRSSRYRPGGSFKLKLEGLCLSFFYPKDKMPIIFNAPDDTCQVSQTIQKTAAAQKVAQSHSGLLVVWFCQIYVICITTTYLHKQN